ncbi:unnamed protein product [Symbiodinium pilosum]|uniref:Uncharacterized protein n=1 Tax=Symbiodinium pilosum TaxID=2952 RepID=A0A812PZW3_SYMPI|nr:unnamed protein product [Symbiodinium pilosum]
MSFWGLRSCLLGVALGSAWSANCKYPGGECYELKLQKCQGSDNWTIHGLWPEWDNGCPGSQFDITALASMRSDLDQKWMSCPEFGESNENFWKHEWEKHGTCSGMQEASFFQKGLQLYDQYKVKCASGNDGKECAVCFNKDLATLETCPSEAWLTV